MPNDTGQPVEPLDGASCLPGALLGWPWLRHAICLALVRFRENTMAGKGDKPKILAIRELKLKLHSALTILVEQDDLAV